MNEYMKEYKKKNGYAKSALLPRKGKERKSLRIEEESGAKMASA